MIKRRSQARLCQAHLNHVQLLDHVLTKVQIKCLNGNKYIKLHKELATSKKTPKINNERESKPLTVAKQISSVMTQYSNTNTTLATE